MRPVHIVALLAALKYATALSSDLGLNPDGLHYGQMSVGFIPGWGEAKSPSTASSINALLPKPMGVIGAYAQIDPSDTTFAQIETYVKEVLKQPGKPVLQLALMPTQGLASVTQQVADRLAAKFAEINSRGLTVWLRYAHEMNGDWYAWGGKPSAFIASWRMMYTSIHAKAPKTYMNWSPNSYFGQSLDDPHGGYTQYWPGKQYVDMVGISFYHYGGQERQNIMPAYHEAFDKITQFDKLYASGQGLPMILSETGASYTTILQTGKPESGGASEHDIKMEWLRQLLSCDILRSVTSLKAITWFEVIKDENATGNTITKQEDFRLISTTDKTLNSDALKYLSNADAAGSACTKPTGSTTLTRETTTTSRSSTSTSKTSSTPTGSATGRCPARLKH